MRITSRPVRQRLGVLDLFRKSRASPDSQILVPVIVIVLLLAFLGSIKLGAIFRLVSAPDSIQRDFIQEYLLGSALRHRLDPYLPIPVLTRQLVGPVQVELFSHPTPHPPAVALIAWPLSVLNYRQASAVWLVLESATLALSLWLLFSYFDRRPSILTLSFAAFAAIQWAPVWTEMALGQYMILLLCLFLAGWLALRSGRNAWGGVLLGIIICLKLIAGPFVIFLALRKKWGAVATATFTTIVGHLLAGLAIGFDRVLYYYSSVGGEVFRLYRSAQNNISAWSIGWKVFDGMIAPNHLSCAAPPLVASTVMARALSLALPVGILIISLRMAIRCREFDRSFAILVCASILVSPVAWNHYLVLMAIPMAVCLKTLHVLSFPRFESVVLVFLIIVYGLPIDFLNDLAILISGANVTPGEYVVVPFAVGLLPLVLTAAVCAMILLIWSLDKSVVRDQVRVDAKGSNETAEVYCQSPLWSADSTGTAL